MGVVLQGPAVVLVVLHGDDGPLRSQERRFHGNGLAADDAEVVPLVDVHLREHHRPDLAAHVVDGTAGEVHVPHADLLGGTGVGVDDQHGRGGVDAAVDHLPHRFVVDRSGGIAALVVPDAALAKACGPHAVENVRVTGVGEDQRVVVGLHRGDHVLILAGDVQDLDLSQIHLGVLCVIGEPGEDTGIVEHLLFHKGTSSGNMFLRDQALISCHYSMDSGTRGEKCGKSGTLRF